MKPKLRRWLSVPLSVAMLFCMMPTTAMTITAADEQPMLIGDENPIVTYAQPDVQQGVILHCFDWSFDNIKANMADIAAAGYTAIQTSPIQRCKQATYDDTNEVWWAYYQPCDFIIENESGRSALGDKDQFAKMCEVAHQYGIKVIVDVVANHLGNKTGYDKAETIPDDIKNNGAYWHTYWNVENDGSREQSINYSLGGLPDLNTENTHIQELVLDYLKECIDAGADGFRFDAAKHIGVDADGSQYTFWKNTIPAAKDYYLSTNNRTDSFKAGRLYCYGEILDNTQTASYTKYLDALTDTVGNGVRGYVAGHNAGGAGSNNYYNSSLQTTQKVLWAESHDTYSNEKKESTDVSESDINKTWALVSAREGATALYFARTDGYRGGYIGEVYSTQWDAPEVVAANKFHNIFYGQSEYLSDSGNIAYNERGSKGVVLVNVNGTTANVSVTAHKMAAGTYTDHVSGSTFTVANGKISGTIGSTGIAVVYNDGDVDEPTITADTLYLVPNSDWKKDSARFAIYLFNESGNSWVSMTDNDSDGTYEAAVPSGKWTNVIFCRMNPAYSTNAWNYVWGQTNDLAPDSGMDCYIIQPGTWTGSSNPLKWSAGSWSTLTPACDHDYNVTNWTWAPDYSTATATLICSECSDAQPVSATVSVDYVSNIRVHTATVTFGGAAYTDVKYEPMVVQNEPDGGVDYQIENAALLAELYNTIADQHPESIDLSDRNMTVTDGEKITQALQNCFPELFYISYVSYSYSGSKLYEIIPYYSETAETAAAKVAEFYAKADWYLDQIDSSWDDYTKALVLHDLLVLNHYYQIETETEYSSNYTFMIDGWGRCENYAECYAYLLARLGIKSEIVDGTAGGAHEWLKVCRDGKWYAVDITFDDPKVNGADRPNKVSHQYFLLSDTALQNAAKPHSNFTADQYYRTDTAYDGYTSIHSNDNPIFYTNGKYYTLLNSAIVAYNTATDLLNNTNAVTAHKINDIWSAGGSSYWPGNYSSIAYYNGLIYFNGEHTINTYNPATGAVETIYTNTDIQYYGMYIKDGKIYGLTAPDPNTNPTSVEIQMQKYTVTWKNEDGTVLETDTNVAVGTTPSYDGATPTKAATAQYSYTFAGWSPAVAAVTGDVTYTATFTKTTREYTITWKMDDGSTIDTTTVAYGTTPTHADAVKDADAQYTYTFTGWTPTITAVTGEATYTAQFTATPIQAETMTLTAYNFIDWNTMYIYYWGRNDPLGWPGVPMTLVAGSDGLIYTATIPSNVTGVIFNNGDKTAMKQTVDITTGIADGAVWAVYNQTDANGNYTPKEVPTYYLVGTMNSWDTAGAPVFSPNKNDNHKEEYVLTTELTQGDRIKARDITSETGWFPYGEDPGITINRTGTYNIYLRPNRDGNADWNNYVLYAQAVTHTVTFDSNDGSAVESQTVYHNETATAPKTAPAKYGYDFMGWYNGDEAYEFDTPVTGDLTLTAHWEETQVSITYTDINGIDTVTRVGMLTGTYTLPAAPYLDGYDFGGWTVNSVPYKDKDNAVAQINYLVRNGSPVAVRVVYNKQAATYKLIVANGTIKDTDGTTESRYQASEQIYVVADDDSEGHIFSCWKASYGGTDEVVVGYERTYAFRMPAKGVTLTACYVSQAEDVADKLGTAYIESVKSPAANKLSFVSIVSVPSEARIKRAGIIAQTAAELNGAELTVDNARFVRYNDTTCKNYLAFKYTWTKGSVSADDTWCVRAYLVYTQGGKEYTVLGTETVSACLQDFA